MRRQILISFGSDYIVKYTIKHGISFDGIGLTNRNEIGGDLMPPMLGIEAFLELLKRRCDLFTQDEYADFYLNVLHARHGEQWSKALLTAQRKHNSKGLLSDEEYIQKRLDAFRYRAKRNFYVSMIDTLHAWALLQEAKWYDICYIDSQLDALAKTDLTLIKDEKKIRIALYGPKDGETHWLYKKKHRRNGEDFSDVHGFRMPWGRDKIANKRWYKLCDFLPIKPEEIEWTDVSIKGTYKQRKLFADTDYELWEIEARDAPYID